MSIDFKHLCVRIETEALVSVHEVATEAQRSSLGLSLDYRKGCTVSVCEADPDIMLNRSTGLGVFHPAEDGVLEWAVQKYLDHGVKRAFIAITEDSLPENLATQAKRMGLEEARAWTKFLRDSGPPVPAHSALKVKPLDRYFAVEWGRIVADSFGMPNSTGPLLGQLINHPGWRLFMSFSGDQPVGAAGMFVRGKLAWLDWAATLPGFRGMGGQGALMCARIEAAFSMGCTQIMTATGEAVDGDPQHSWGNIGRQGFKPVSRSRNFTVTSQI